jgi:hypothetical protein
LVGFLPPGGCATTKLHAADLERDVAAAGVTFLFDKRLGRPSLAGPGGRI